MILNIFHASKGCYSNFSYLLTATDRSQEVHSTLGWHQVTIGPYQRLMKEMNNVPISPVQMTMTWSFKYKLHIRRLFQIQPILRSVLCSAGVQFAVCSVQCALPGSGAGPPVVNSTSSIYLKQSQQQSGRPARPARCPAK